MARTKILIAGAGISGLAIAIMLERLPEDKKVDYLILERSVMMSSMGSAVSLHTAVFPLLKQLGIWPEIERISKPMSHFCIKRADGSDLGTVDYAYGDLEPELHSILMSHVPSSKIVLGKRIIATTQDDTGVSCHCADSTIYHADILIGADGAYSAVRQSLYKDLWAHGNLPRQDISPIKLDQVVVVGITEPLSPTDYPLLKEDVCQFRIVLGGHDRPYTVTLGWSIGGRSNASDGSSFWSESQDEATDSYAHANDSTRNADWSEAETESIDEICSQMRTIRNPFGFGTYGDLIDKTPRHMISKVMFEEKGFRTCMPQGVVNAMFDGACLVNLIHDLSSQPTMDDLGELFQTYFERRYPAARIAIEGSSQFSRLFHDQAQVEEDGRVVMYNSIPRWLQRWTLDRNNKVDPQLDFVLTKMSRTPSIQSFSTVLDETALFEADEPTLAPQSRISFSAASVAAAAAALAAGAAGVDDSDVATSASSPSVPVDIPRHGSYHNRSLP
ncbi:hypothetical protein BGX24_001200 [Mortierella sp. AD032]|nr:hypothetical protein BGX24_001200 [Mortierella sp. AD032]